MKQAGKQKKTINRHKVYLTTTKIFESMFLLFRIMNELKLHVASASDADVRLLLATIAGTYRSLPLLYFSSPC